ncbi:hypothetical protein AURANDRAFT_68247 [Aureococcus anophagefferens]|uniref:Major facilitator superfamily associated domain-containing protein n=1 Tax=Aureococcus anophagefferens TaxID=44056 RepID=F0YNZ9_AURAN|nr:hypothetical protein AURANDRAFT_68247 [Aureococcus anophagefferens]EGB03163.1 hypothetical protein AURANDRAFT_68247 [Aureococcus anophagefferens]|eukprot:XP_009042139.1 hypothetical protein AURANDRAFT_68247 [Aureococcus anophagefferens]
MLRIIRVCYYLRRRYISAYSRQMRPGNLSRHMYCGLLTAMTVCNAVSGQLLTAFADRYSCHRNVALTSFTLFVIFTCSLVFSNHFAYTAGVGILAQCYLFSTIDGYLALWIIDLGGNSSLVGAMYAVASIVEIPLFFWSDRIYHRIGMKWVLAITSVAYLIRVVSYSLLQNPYYVLLIEPIHALTIALFWGPCVTYMNDVLLHEKPHLKATGQGWLSDVGGMRFMFRSTLVAVGSLMILVINFWRLERFAQGCGSVPKGETLKGTKDEKKSLLDSHIPEQ